MDPELRALREELATACPMCGGMGMRVVDEDGRRYATRCECSYARRAFRAIERAGIPTRHESSTFENFNSVAGYPSIGLAAMRLKEFVESWKTMQPGLGILLTGTVGAGKTHLAVATLRSLITQYNAVGLFCDHRSLLKAVQNSYGQNSTDSEREILAPVFEADVLVLDELGSGKGTDWTTEMVEHILNTRYNDRRTTIITTNFSNQAPAPCRSLKSEAEQAKEATRVETLGDRIGERMFSRVQEMCIVVDMQGEDFRRHVKRASFA